MARGLNKVMLIGNVGQDPDSRYTPSGTLVVNFSLATSYGRQQPNGEYRDETTWHRIVAFERVGEIVQQYVAKGSRLYVEGRLQSRKFTDNSGMERTVYEIVATDVLLLDKRRSDESGGDDWGGAAGNHLSVIRDEDVPF